MKRWFFSVVSLLMLFGIMVSFVIQRSYYKTLCREELKLKNELNRLIDENRKISYEIEKLTTIEKLIKDQDYKVSLNKVIVIEDEN